MSLGNPGDPVDVVVCIEDYGTTMVLLNKNK